MPLPFPNSEGMQTVFVDPEEDNTIVFAEEFTKLQGKFAYCIDETDLKVQLFQLLQTRSWKLYHYAEPFVARLFPELALHQDLASCDVAITGCEYISARTGSIILSSAMHNGRTTSVYAPIHICIAYTSQLKKDIRDVFLSLKETNGNNFPSLVTFATGPSRTADIEKTLVTGVHGPKEVYCFLVEDEASY